MTDPITTPAAYARHLLELRWFWSRVIELRDHAHDVGADKVSDWLSHIEDEIRVEVEVGQLDLRDALNREGG